MLKTIKSTVLAKAVSLFSGYSLHDKFYKAGLVSVFTYIGVCVVIMMVFGQEYIQSIIPIFIVIILSTCTIGVAVEAWFPIKLLFNKTWVRWVLGVTSILVYKYAECQSDDFINRFTGIDPSLLPFSSSVLAALYLPYSWLVVTSFIFSLYVIFHWFFIPFESSKGERALDGSKYLMRVLGVMVIFLAVNNAVRFFENPESIASLVAGKVVLNTEYFPRSHCENVQPNEISADIGRGYISIFNKSTNVFHTEKCKLAI